ncbi:hypothetical protein [Haloglycomyces albus]|uniref:hypothetical protein n=1 Tax=Haloglycomyces albus TaxID=526067 RepID=UPI00046CFB02|nr:hypothetical protein [Haloglycomyces albus]
MTRTAEPPERKRRIAVVYLPDWQGTLTDFDPVVSVVDDHAAFVETLWPGTVALAVPRHLDESSFAESLIDALHSETAWDALVGIADGFYAALIAAFDGRIVPSGTDRSFLAPTDVNALMTTGLVDEDTCVLLRHLGIDTLGAFAQLPPEAVVERFGSEVRQAHRLARGEADRLLRPRVPTVDLSVEQHSDPPLTTADRAVHFTRTLAQRLRDTLEAHSVTCRLLTIRATTASADVRQRTWRLPSLTTDEVVRRSRWQIEGWLASGDSDDIASVALIPEEITDLLDAQTALWEVDDRRSHRAEQALTHVQSLLGPDAVTVARTATARDITAPPSPEAWGTAPPRPQPGPWPGRLEGLPPAVQDGSPVELLNSAGLAVRPKGRGLLDSTPRYLLYRHRRLRIRSWAGPWPVWERWWDRPRHYSRLQVDPYDTRPALLMYENHRWRVGGWYD